MHVSGQEHACVYVIIHWVARKAVAGTTDQNER